MLFFWYIVVFFFIFFFVIYNFDFFCLQLQERILNSANNAITDSMQTIRAESVPPNVTCTNTQPFLQRAQSEQPPAGPNGCFQANYQSCSQNPSNYRQYPFACQNHAQLYRQISQTNNNRSMRYATNSIQLPVISQRSELNQNYYQNEILTHQQQQQQQHMHMQPAILNNDPNSPLLNTVQCQQSSPPIFIHHNNNTAAATANNNNTNINNQLHQQNIAAASAASVSATTTTTSNGNSSYSQNVAPALNNQVPPGNRANNYWDNFRR